MNVHRNVGRKRLGHVAVVPSRVSQISQGKQRQCQIRQSPAAVQEKHTRGRLQEKYNVDISFSSSFTCDLDNNPSFMSALDKIEKRSLHSTSKSDVVQNAINGTCASHHLVKSPVDNKISDAKLCTKENRPARNQTPIHKEQHRRHSSELSLSVSPFDITKDQPIDMSTPVGVLRTSGKGILPNENGRQPTCSKTKPAKEHSTANRKRKVNYDDTPTRVTRASSAKKHNNRRPTLEFSEGNCNEESPTSGNKSDFFKSLLLGNSSMEMEQYSVCSEIKLHSVREAEHGKRGATLRSSENLHVEPTLHNDDNTEKQNRSLQGAVNEGNIDKVAARTIPMNKHGQVARVSQSRIVTQEHDGRHSPVEGFTTPDKNVESNQSNKNIQARIFAAPSNETSDIPSDHLSLTSWGLPESVLQQYHRRGITHMFQWQAECLLTGNVLNGGNLVYSAPTSAGKTMVAELLVLKRVLEARKKAIIILPFVSVTREKMFYLQELYQDAGVRVSGFMGHYTPAGGFSSVDVAVCTIEKGNGLINRLLEENKLDQLGVIVVDELHLVGDVHRGYLLELLLTKIAYMSHRVKQAGTDSGIQIVGMSATLPNLDLLARWLNADLYHTDYRPVPLSECVKIGTAVYNSSMKLLRDINTKYAIKGDEEHVVPLCIETIQAGHSILIFCPTKNWCEKLAQTVAKSLYDLLKDPTVAVADPSGNVTIPGLLVLPLNKQLLKDVVEQLRRSPVGLDGVLGQTVPYGVAYHHAGLTFDERDVVEGAFRQGVLKVLIATSTLSSGVNLPARRVLIRTPVFHGHLIDFLTYKQMIGRAGRKGVDTAGESILLCKPNEKSKAVQLVGGVLPPVQSTLIRHKGEELSTSLKRAILEVVVSGVAQSRDDVAAYVSCTLLAAAIPANAGNQGNLIQDGGRSGDWTVSLIQQCIGFLQDNEFVCLQTIRMAEGGECKRFTATQLGSAVLASSLSPDEGLVVFSELQRARQSFVLENELHIIYQVTPIYSQTIAEGIDWYQFFCIWETLPAGMRRVAELVGVQESFLARAVRGRILTKTESQCRQVAIHKRFYTALVLHDLVQEMPLGQVACKYNCNKGQLQALQQSSATFAGMVTVFCARLGWSNLELILSQFQRRLTFGVQRELCDLVRISALNGQRARLMFNGGYQTVAALATAQPEHIETLLKTSAPFQSKKKQDSETDWEAERRYKARCIFLTGRQGVTELEAAVAIINEAKAIVQEDLGGLGIQWQSDSVKQAPPDPSPVLTSPLSDISDDIFHGFGLNRESKYTRNGIINKVNRSKLKHTPQSSRKCPSLMEIGNPDRLPVPCVISPTLCKQTTNTHKATDQPLSRKDVDQCETDTNTESVCPSNISATGASSSTVESCATTVLPPISDGSEPGRITRASSADDIPNHFQSIQEESEVNTHETNSKHLSTICSDNKTIKNVLEKQNSEEESKRMLSEEITCNKDSADVSDSPKVNNPVITTDKSTPVYSIKTCKQKHVKFSNESDVEINTPTIQKVEKLRKFRNLSSSNLRKPRLVVEKSKVKIIEICDENESEDGNDSNEYQRNSKVGQNVDSTNSNTTNSTKNVTVSKEENKIETADKAERKDECADFSDDFTDTFMLNIQTDSVLDHYAQDKKQVLADNTSNHLHLAHQAVPQDVQNSESLFSEDPNFDASVLISFNIDHETNECQAKAEIEEVNTSEPLLADEVAEQDDKLKKDAEEIGTITRKDNLCHEAPAAIQNIDDEELEQCCDALERNISARSDEDMFNQSDSLIAASDYDRVVLSQDIEESKHDLDNTYEDLHIAYQSGQEICFEQNDTEKAVKEVPRQRNVQTVLSKQVTNANGKEVLGQFSSQQLSSARMFAKSEIDTVIALEMAESFCDSFDYNELKLKSKFSTGNENEKGKRDDNLNDSLTFSMMEKVLEGVEKSTNELNIKLDNKPKVETVSKVCNKLDSSYTNDKVLSSNNVTKKQSESSDFVTSAGDKHSQNTCLKLEKRSRADSLTNEVPAKRSFVDKKKPILESVSKTTETPNQDCVKLISSNKTKQSVKLNKSPRKQKVKDIFSEHTNESRVRTRRKRKLDTAAGVPGGSSHNTSAGSDCVPPTPPSPSDTKSSRCSFSVFSPRMQHVHSSKDSQTKPQARTFHMSKKEHVAEKVVTSSDKKRNIDIDKTSARRGKCSVDAEVNAEASVIPKGNSNHQVDNGIPEEDEQTDGRSSDVQVEDDKLSPSFIDPNESGVPCTQSSFTVIDVCGDKRLFKTFIKEWRTKTRYAVSLACETIPQMSRDTVIGANFKKAAAAATSSVSYADTGIRIGQTDLVIVGIAVSWENRDAYYVSFTKQPSQCNPGDSLCEPPPDQDISINIRVKAVKSVLQQAVCGDTPVSIIMFDVKTHYRALVEGCGFAPSGQFSDPKIACWMLDPSGKEKNLHRMVTNFLPTEVYLLQGLGGGVGFDSVGMSPKNPGSGRVRSSLECVLVQHLDMYFTACLQKEGIQSVFTDVEMPAAITLCRLELNGFGFSLEESESQKSVMLAKLSALEDQAYLLAGHPFSLSATDDVSQVLFIELQLPPNGDPSSAVSRPANMRGGRKGRQKCTLSTSKDVLEKLKKFHPLPAVILEWRRITNALSKTLFPLQNDKVRCAYLSMYRIYSECQLHSATGRVSFSEPNLQNVPKEFEITMPDMIGESPTSNQSAPVRRYGRRGQSRYSALASQHGAAKVTADNPGLKFCVCMRQAFVAFDGGVLLAADYSQLELRMIAHLSRDEKLIRILNEDGDVFKLIAGQWKNKEANEVTATERAHAKQICYGMLYGIGPKALGEQLEVDENDAAAFMETFKAKYPGMRHYLRQTVEECRTKGFVQTMLGRRRYLPSITSPNPYARAQAERQAVNTTIQGSAADLVKIAMIRIDQEMLKAFPATQFTHRHPHNGKGDQPRPEGAYLVLQLHDELIYEVSRAHVTQVAAIVTRCMEHAIELPVKMPVKVKVGQSWGDLQEIQV